MSDADDECDDCGRSLALCSCRLCCCCGEPAYGCTCAGGPLLDERAVGELLASMIESGIELVDALARLGLKPYSEK